MPSDLLWAGKARLTAIVPAALLFLVTSATGSAQTWNLVWSDEFNGTAKSQPNTQYWGFDQGLPPDGGQNYNCLFGQNTNGCDPNNPNVYLDGSGHLVIVARKATGAPNGITSGRIHTSSGTNDSTILYSTQYGRMEASIQLPVNSGNQGVWPAFWMLGNNISTINWPSCGEIDIMEYIGKANPTQIYGTLHGQAYANTGLGYRATNSGGWSGYHTFGIIWSPNLVEFYVDDPTNIYGSLTPSQLAANQSWVNGGLSAWPFNNPFFFILNLNMGGPFPGNVDSTTTYPQQMLVDYVRVYKANPPAAPTTVTATAGSSSQATLHWTASTSSNVTYNIYRSTVSGFTPYSQANPNGTTPAYNQTLIANNITATSYTDANLAPGTPYYYIITASGAYSGETAAAQVSVTTSATGTGSNGGAIYIDAGSYSGTGTYLKDTGVSGGFASTSTNVINTSAVTNPAPLDAYRTERWGPSSYVIGNLTPGSGYNVRLHFVESAFTAAGQRQFNVAINGQQVLTNFDIFAAAGAQNKAVTQQFTAKASQTGSLTVELTPGAADQPEIRALDVTAASGGTNYGAAAGSTTYVAVNSGGPVQGNFQADQDAGNFGLPQNSLTWGGGTNTTTQSISTSGVTNPAPAAVYQTERYGGFGYVFPGLVANSTYTVRLHFAEGVQTYNAAGDRLFNVSVNGTQILTNYDIYANAHAVDQAVIKQLTAKSDEHGILSVQFSVGPEDLPSLRGIEVTQSSGSGSSGAIQIDSGGSATGTWVADVDFTNGTSSYTSNTINTSKVTNPAPLAVYQTERYGTFTYTIPNVSSGSHTVRLHFAEFYWTQTGQRQFNVIINGTQVLTNFDIIAASGGPNTAVVEQFTATPNASGQIAIQFTTGSADLPKISGVEVQ